MHNLAVGVPRSNYLSIQTTPFPEVNLSKFGKGSNSVHAQVGQDDQAALKRDREYIRRIIKESKVQRAQSQNGDSPRTDKLKWN